MTKNRPSALVQARLKDLRIPFRSGLAKTGVVAQIKGGLGDGPCVLLRADMDALPIDEMSGVPFASEIPGVMHACGHDAHTAMLLGAAQLLLERRSRFAGTVKLMFQPAEEGRGGAVRMIEDGVLSDPPVDAAFALHVWPDLDADHRPALSPSFEVGELRRQLQEGEGLAILRFEPGSRRQRCGYGERWRAWHEGARGARSSAQDG